MTALEIADIIGTISFALSGFLIAVYYRLDIFGVFTSAFLTAFGGGILRDVFAGKTPYIFTSELPLILVVSTVLIAILFKLHKIIDIEKRWAFIVSDAIGLSSFAITGAIIALEKDLNFLGVVLLSFITAVGGGTIRDTLINRIPFILVSEFYATIAMFIGTIVYFLDIFELRNIFTLSIIFVFGVLIRVLAYYKQWHLPTLSKDN
ncbi:trimeric intracellular cation channel family protein [Arcobacter porcinus]|uniref:UPF0126 domain-containing membrane protein n=1 Tax=Arcobacter porcinus TaxID=1935204 RepID=A0A5C2HGW9_9BACT|nr:trimeric intracellular cation channel family protein [Arcobacter porcinus]OCL97365.1 hypothetical protein AAX27_00273 [Aliarcobacter thereius]QEP41625.1 UPF0126 domain-containing membrane protein [Arcobacter porcinus]